jgi:O-antigen/teichoic acid export membrane protein
MARSVIGNLALPLAVFATAPILARTLGVTGRGELAAATAPLILMTAVATVGIPEAITYVVARRPALVRLAIRRGTLLLAIVGAAATGVTDALASVLSAHKADVRTLILLTSIAIVPVLMIGSLRGAASALHLWTLVNREKYVTSIIRAGGIFGLLIANRLTIYTVSAVIASSALIAGAVYLPLRKYTQAVSDARDPMIGRQLIAYGSRVWIGSLSGILLSRLDQAIMAPLAGATQLGLYAAAVNVSDASLLVNNAVRDVTFAADATQRSNERLARTARVSFLASAIGGAAISALLPIWFPLLFGRGFRGAEPVAYLLIASNVLGSPASIAGTGLSSRGRPGMRSAALVAACLVNVGLLLLLVPRWGAAGAGVATLVGTLVAATLGITFASRICGIRAADFFMIRPSDAEVLWRTLRRLVGRPARQPRSRPSREGRHRG